MQAWRLPCQVARELGLIANKTPLTDKNGHVHTVPQAQVDGNLLNPWGLTFSPLGSAFWVSDNGAGKATLYIVPGNAQNSMSIAALVVNIPAPGTQNVGNGGTPTGAVFNITRLGLSGADEPT